jgi:Concanavalin A-like lectin/glucanases superfamily
VARIGRSFPNRVVYTGGQVDSRNAAYPLRSASIGPRPPLVIGQPPTSAQQTIRVNAVAVRDRRATERKRFSLQGWSGDSPGSNGQYASIVEQAGPFAYWRLGEAAGNAIDSSGNGNTGTYSGTVARAQPGAIVGDPNGAVGLSQGNTSEVNVSGGAPYLPGKSVWTFECWLKSTGPSDIFSLMWAETGSGNDLIRIETAAGIGPYSNIGLVYINDDGSFGANNSFGSVVADGSWHHLVVTRNGNQFSAYIDGAGAGGFTGTPGPQTDPTFVSQIGDSGTNAFPGTIDEVALYSRVLSAGEISAHYIAGVVNHGGPAVLLKRNLGIWPPRLILPLPGQQQQTIEVTLDTTYRRGLTRRFPLQGWTDQSGQQP